MLHVKSGKVQASGLHQPENSGVAHHIDPDADLCLAARQCLLHAAALHGSLSSWVSSDNWPVLCVFYHGQMTRGKAKEARPQSGLTPGSRSGAVRGSTPPDR